MPNNLGVGTSMLGEVKAPLQQGLASVSPPLGEHWPGLRQLDIVLGQFTILDHNLKSWVGK